MSGFCPVFRLPILMPIRAPFTACLGGGPRVYVLPVVEATDHFNSSSGAVTINKPAGTVDGDLLVTHISRRRIGGGGSPQIGTPIPDASGWEVLWVEDVSGTVASASAMFARIVVGGDTSWTAAIPGGDWSGSFTWRISGADPADPIDGAVSVIGQPSLIVPTITPTRDNSLLLMGCASGEGSGAPGVPAEATLDDSDNHTTGDGYVHAEAQEDFLIAGPTGTRTFTGSFIAARPAGGGMAVINPA